MNPLPAHRPRNFLFDVTAPIWDVLMGRWALRDVLRRLGPGRGKRVLDLGGATGRLSVHLARLGMRPVVLDPSLPMVRRARRRGLAAVAGSAHALPFRDEAFDAIVVLDALHHVPEIPRSLREAARVLAPGGRLLLHEPDPETALGRLTAVLERLAGMGSLLLPATTLSALLREAGLEVPILERKRFHLEIEARKPAGSAN